MSSWTEYLLDGGVILVCAETIAIETTSAIAVAAVWRALEWRMRIVIGKPFHAATGGEESREVCARSHTRRTHRTADKGAANSNADPQRGARCAIVCAGPGGWASGARLVVKQVSQPRHASMQLRRHHKIAQNAP